MRNLLFSIILCILVVTTFTACSSYQDSSPSFTTSEDRDSYFIPKGNQNSIQNQQNSDIKEKIKSGAEDVEVKMKQYDKECEK